MPEDGCKKSSAWLYKLQTKNYKLKKRARCPKTVEKLKTKNPPHGSINYKLKTIN